MSASVEAISRLLEDCESASDEDLMALGRAINSLEWTAENAAGAPLFLALIRVPLAAYVERTFPDVGLDEVLSMFEEVTSGG